MTHSLSRGISIPNQGVPITPTNSKLITGEEANKAKLSDWIFFFPLDNQEKKECSDRPCGLDPNGGSQRDSLGDQKRWFDFLHLPRLLSLLTLQLSPYSARDVYVIRTRWGYFIPVHMTMGGYTEYIPLLALRKSSCLMHSCICVCAYSIYFCPSFPRTNVSGN